MLTENQHALLSDLASHILAELELRQFMHRPDSVDVIFCHEGHASFEAACAILQQLGLAHPVDWKTGEPHADRAQWSMRFRLAAPTDVVDILAGQPDLDLAAIDRALSVFLDLKINYGLAPPLTATRSSFAAPAGLERTIGLLRACGYVEGDHAHVRWTTKCSWAMRKNYLWTDDNRSQREADEAACDEEARRILATMPDDVRQMLRQRAPDLVGLTEQIARRWRDGRWQAPTAELSLAGQLAIARRVTELHRAG